MPLAEAHGSTYLESQTYKKMINELSAHKQLFLSIQTNKIDSFIPKFQYLWIHKG